MSGSTYKKGIREFSIPEKKSWNMQSTFSMSMVLCRGVARDPAFVTARAIIMKGSKIISSCMGDTMLKGCDVGMDILKEAVNKGGIELSDLEGVLATGYGRFRFSAGEKHLVSISRLQAVSSGKRC